MADHSLHLSVADQCIVCLETLGRVESKSEVELDAVDVPASVDHNDEEVAAIRECGHVLHALCLKDWIEKANSCPICRQTFHLVDVFDKIGGKLLDTFPVEDKKQVADFDPTAWIEDQADDLFESNPCPICDSADDEEVLLLCDACDAPYHTYCVGLEEVPHGHWFCMECQSEGESHRAADPTRTIRAGRQPRTFAQRTQAQVRRGRRGGRADGWHSAWDALTERVWDALNMDLDAPDNDDHYTQYRTHQRRTDRERREFRQWQRRLDIAGRQGAGNIFRQAARPIFSPIEQPKTPEQTPEEKKAWEAFEKARDMDVNTPSSRKRKSRSITNSPREKALQEPERKLKRPRTRRVVDKPGSSSDVQPNRRENGLLTAAASAPPPAPEANAPSFLSTLLKEVEMSTSTDDEGTLYTHQATATSPSIDYSSPAVSPSTSNYSTPRALSITPPPHGIRRPGSPLPLTSHIEPIFPPADYSPNRSPPDHHSSDGPGPGSRPMTPELRHPRPRKKQAALPRSEETSPTRANMSIEAKEGINRIVRNALDPHYKKPAGITKEQYANINRAVSRMLYDRIAEEAERKAEKDASLRLDSDRTKEKWEGVAKREVKKAVEGLGA